MIVLSKEHPISFLYEAECPSGIQKIADKVRTDVELVLGFKPGRTELPAEEGAQLIFGIVSESPLIKKLSEEGRIDTAAIAGKREVYGFFPLDEKTLVIAGSDKRGTIYGLFHLSELLGVSPYVNWSALKPAKKESFSLDESMKFISKEPSVEYRGFFINDEWPAFGNWCDKHFGGFTAEMYEGVFELLLRLKGNYLWPAMWSSCFAEDGPGLKSAELADELGVVMGLSHHEPCLRHGEEYSHVRGKDSIYGDAWNFRANKEGITRFWRDGLKRNGHLENVITVGMRGEQDSKILGEDATLKDNIDLLRDVLRTQEQLIKEEVNEDLSKVPRMLALYKEVEAYYYGNEDTPGLKEGCKELEDVILMLCEDNQGYLRSLPDEQMRSHPGGFGMYYHFDYHGGPISYEWIDSTHLPEVWQQMCTAYEHGVQRLWIVNVGDLGLQEFPLSYFLELAYDFDKWGSSNMSSAREYCAYWMEKNLGHAFSRPDYMRLAEIKRAASRLIHNRRPEHMNAEVYRVDADYEAARVLKQCEMLENEYKSIAARCPAEYADALFELLGYNILAGLNHIRLWLLRACDHFYASLGSVAANAYVQRMRQALARDGELKEQLSTAAGGKWDGFADALHIGFTRWNSEECRNPIEEYVTPIKGEALVVGLFGDAGATRGMVWSKKTLQLYTFAAETEKTAEASFFAALCGDTETEFTLSTDADWIRLPSEKEKVSPDTPLAEIGFVIDKEKAAGAEGSIFVKYSEGCAQIRVHAPKEPAEAGVFAERKGRIIMDAAHYSDKKDTDAAALAVFPALGRREDGLGLMPFRTRIEDPESAPYAEYAFESEAEGEYVLGFQLLPTNPYRDKAQVYLCYSMDNGGIKRLPVFPEGHEAGASWDWGEGVLKHFILVTDKLSLTSGRHSLRFFGTEPELVLERVGVCRKGSEAVGSYLGPEESRRR
ncbi:MAG: glycosyl hydrolase 115 family protein [Lachnospiraceae bacterium]|nr:glycosyl hydrolase 115 family protein [Lachnospiraceae bacterium]